MGECEAEKDNDWRISWPSQDSALSLTKNPGSTFIAQQVMPGDYTDNAFDR